MDFPASIIFNNVCSSIQTSIEELEGSGWRSQWWLSGFTSQIKCYVGLIDDTNDILIRANTLHDCNIILSRLKMLNEYCTQYYLCERTDEEFKLECFVVEFLSNLNKEFSSIVVMARDMESIGEEELFRAMCLCDAYGDSMVKIRGKFSSIDSVFEEFMKVLEFKKNVITMKLINDTFEEDILRILKDNNKASFVIFEEKIHFANDPKILYEVQSLVFSAKKYGNTIVHEAIFNEGTIPEDSNVCDWKINELGYSIVHVAVLKNDVSLLKKLLEYKPNSDVLHAVTTDGKTVFDLAVECGNFDAINVFINYDGFNAEYFLKGKKYTLNFLNTLIGDNEIELLKTLLTTLIEICGSCAFEELISSNLLQKAVQCNNIDIAEWLLSLWPKSKFRPMFNNGTILHVAAENKVDRSLMELLMEGTSLEFREHYNLDGYSALHRALYSKDIVLVRLLEHNVSEDFCDQVCTTKYADPILPIQVACHRGVNDFVKDILANRPIEYREQMLSSSYSATVKRTLLEEAISHNQLDVVRTLLNGARPSIINIHPKMTTVSYLHIAVRYRHAEIIRALLEFEPDLSKYERERDNPMTYLVKDFFCYHFKPQVPLSAKQEVFEALIENIGWNRHLHKSFTSNKEQMNNFYSLLLKTWAEQCSRVLWLLDDSDEKGFQVFWSNDSIAKDVMMWIDDIAWR